MQLKTIKSIKPIYAQCRQCFKKYNMLEYGVSCPMCSKIKSQKIKRKH